MEVPGAANNKLMVCLFEVIGTAMLLLSVNWGTAEAVAGIIFTAIIMFGPISGAHFNPAVTIGVLVTQQSWKDNIGFALIVIISEIVGAFLGCLLARTAYIRNLLET